jgi:hypothetical protein
LGLQKVINKICIRMNLIERIKWVVEGNKTWKEEKGKYQSSVKPFYLKRWSNWMKSLITTKIYDQYELAMMVSHGFSLAH